MNPPTVSSTGVQPLAVVLSETRPQAPTKDGIASGLLKVSQVNYEMRQPDYSYTPTNYEMRQPDYSYTPTYQPPYYPSYPPYAPTPTENGTTFDQGYDYSAPLAPNMHPNDAGQPGARRPAGVPGDLLAKTSPQHGNNPPTVGRWSGAVGRHDGRPVTANLSIAVQGTAAVGFQISSDGVGPSRFKADEQAYWKALGFQNTSRT